MHLSLFSSISIWCWDSIADMILALETRCPTMLTVTMVGTACPFITCSHLVSLLSFPPPISFPLVTQLCHQLDHLFSVMHDSSTSSNILSEMMTSLQTITLTSVPIRAHLLTGSYLLAGQPEDRSVFTPRRTEGKTTGYFAFLGSVTGVHQGN